MATLQVKSDDFIEATTYIRVLEKRMLDKNSVERILDSNSAAEAMRIISQNSEYDLAGANIEYEQTLKECLKEVYNLAYKLAKQNRIVVDIAAAKYDYHNLKTAFKAWIINDESDATDIYSNISEFDMQDIYNFIKNNEKEIKAEIPNYVKNAINETKTYYDETKDSQMIDLVLDRHMFARMLELAKIANNDYIIRYVQLSIDFYNLKVLLRVKNMKKGLRFLGECLVKGGLCDSNMFLSNYDKNPEALAGSFYYQYFGDTMQKGMSAYAKISNYSDLERLLDNDMLSHIKQSKYIAYGAEVLFSYVICKENEIKQIRILLSGKTNDIPSELLRERLRDNYA